MEAVVDPIFRVNPTNYSLDKAINNQIAATNRAAFVVLGTAAATVAVGFTFTASFAIIPAILTAVFVRDFFRERAVLDRWKTDYSARAEELNQSLAQPGGLDFEALDFFKNGIYRNGDFPNELKRLFLIEDVRRIPFKATLEKYDRVTEKYRIPILIKLSDEDNEFNLALHTKFLQEGRSLFDTFESFKNFSMTFKFGYTEEQLKGLYNNP